MDMLSKEVVAEINHSFQLELEDQGFERVSTEKLFLISYPPKLWNCYRPQPDNFPEKYPVMFREEAIIDCDSCDRAIISYVYL
jgi:hypothetical protein